jgi:hypothetical protein
VEFGNKGKKKKIERKRKKRNYAWALNSISVH